MPDDGGAELARIYPTCVACAAKRWRDPDAGMVSFLALLAGGAAVGAIVLDLCGQHRDKVRQVVVALAEETERSD